MATPSELFARASRYPLGTSLFSKIVAQRAPYFASISPLFLELKPGLARVLLRNRRKVHNHLGSINAIAMCAAAELAAGTMMESSLPRGMRWIPRGMTVRYLKQGLTDLVATAELSALPVTGFQGDVTVPVRVRNKDGETVMETDIAMYLSTKVKKAG